MTREEAIAMILKELEARIHNDKFYYKIHKARTLSRDQRLAYKLLLKEGLK